MKVDKREGGSEGGQEGGRERRKSNYNDIGSNCESYLAHSTGVSFSQCVLVHIQVLCTLEAKSFTFTYIPSTVCEVQ